jgi:HEAT repeat protein
MKQVRLVGIAVLLTISPVSLWAEDTTNPVDRKLQTVYQRLHFSDQYPPEAVQRIETQLQPATKPLDSLPELAKDDAPEVRRLVAMLVGEYGEPDGAKILWRLVRDDVETVRLSAAAALTRLAQLTKFPIDTSGLQDTRPEVRRFVAGTLQALHNKSAESALIEALKDDNEMVRMEAARALAACGTADAVPSLTDRLRDPSVLVRQAAVHTLGDLGDPSAIGPLGNALKDPDWHVRASAVMALHGLARTPETRAIVTELVIERLKADEFALVRDRAADALTHGDDQREVEALVRAVVTDERDVRVHAAQSIVNAKMVAALPLLMEHRLDPNPEVREKIIQIFGAIGGSGQLAAVADATSDTEPTVQLTAVTALRQLRDRGGLDKLIGKISDPNPHVRAAAIRALGDMGDRTVCPKLIPHLRDESGYVRSAAAEALGKLGDRSSIAPLIQVLAGEQPAENTNAVSGLIIGTGTGALAEFTQLTEVQQKARAVEALGVLRATEAVDSIVKFGLQDKDPILRAVSAYSLGQIRDTRAVEPLQDAVRPYYKSVPLDVGTVIDPGGGKVADEARRNMERESRVRASVAWALGQIGDASARETLLLAASDQNSMVRDAAAEALAKIVEKQEKAATAPNQPATTH